MARRCVAHPPPPPRQPGSTRAGRLRRRSVAVLCLRSAVPSALAPASPPPRPRCRLAPAPAPPGLDVTFLIGTSSIGRVGATRSPRLLCPSTLWCETLSTLPFPAACPAPPAPAPDARASTRPCRSLAAAIDWSGSVCSAAVRPARAGTCRVALPARSLLHALTPALQSPPRPPCLLRLPFASFPSARDHHAALHSHDHPCQAYAGPAPAAQGFILAEHTVDDPPALLQQARDAGSTFIVGGCIDTCRGCCCPVFTSKVVACYCARLMLDSV